MVEHYKSIEAENLNDNSFELQEFSEFDESGTRLRSESVDEAYNISLMYSQQLPTTDKVGDILVLNKEDEIEPISSNETCVIPPYIKRLMEVQSKNKFLADLRKCQDQSCNFGDGIDNTGCKEPISCTL